MSTSTGLRPASPPAAEGTGQQAPESRLRRALRRHGPGGLALTVLLIGVGILHGTNLDGYPAPSIDEGTYVSQAWSVLARGELAPYTYWYDHPPLGWLLLAGGLALTDGLDRAADVVTAGRQVLWVVHLASCALLYAWARRIGLRRGFALLAVLCYSASPLTFFYARQVLLDNLAMPLVLAAFAVAASPRRRLSSGALAGLLFGLACLTKETSLLLLPAIGLQVWRSTRPNTRRYSLAVAATLFAFTVGSYLLLAMLRGELLPGPGHVSLWDGVAFQLFTRDGTPPLWQGGGPQGDTVLRWLNLDPWILGAGLAVALPALAVRRLRPAVLGLALLVLGAVTTGYLPAMYVVGLLPFAALLIAGVLNRMWELRLVRLKEQPVSLVVRRPLAPVAAAVVLAAAVTIGPLWAGNLQRPLTREEDQPGRQAYEWIMANVEPGARLLVDEPLRIELVVNGGFPEEDVVWVYKLDLDPEVAAANPFGWRDFDYVVTTASSRGDANLGEQVTTAMRESELVASFQPPGQTGGGEALVVGQELIEIRALDGAPQGARDGEDDQDALRDAALDVVRDNLDRVWLIDAQARERAEMTGAQQRAAVRRFGPIRAAEPDGGPVLLTGWAERSFDELFPP